MSKTDSLTQLLVSDHAADRWDQRTPNDSVAPETAWMHGQRVTAAELPTGANEVRFHRPTGAILLRHGSTIATVQTVDDCRDAVRRAVEPLLEAQR